MSAPAAIAAAPAILTRAAFAAGGGTEIHQTAIGMSAAIDAAAAIAGALHDRGSVGGEGALNPRRMPRRIEDVEQALVHALRPDISGARFDHLAEVRCSCFDAGAFPIHAAELYSN